MDRGRLRVYLGPAPGAGKTFRMLEEGQRRRRRGSDVVVGLADAKGRPLTSAQLDGMEVVTPLVLEHDGSRREEMDLDAVLERNPAVALVDDLAHRNAPGARNAQRWQDVESLLDAGIDVITTVDVQHLESLNDVVEKITGVPEPETVPDEVVRRAEQIELVDITPEALRRRVAHGNVYPAERIDAMTASYFRTESLAALRELALLWLAERVEDSLQRYSDESGATLRAEPRERLVVGVAGESTDEAVLRRAARIGSRVGAELLALHVARPRDRRPRADTSVARETAEKLGGSYHEIVDDDVAIGLATFARSERGTQIVVGEGRADRGGLVDAILRASRGTDVHVVAVQPTDPVSPRRRRRAGPTAWRRRSAALAGALVVLPALTALLVALGASSAVVFPCYLLAVVALSAWGGTFVGVASALAAAFLENFYFVEPTHTLEVARTEDLVALCVFTASSIAASVLATAFARRADEADRARAEAAALARAAATASITGDDLTPVLDSLRAIFGAGGVAVLEQREGRWSPILEVGDQIDASRPLARFTIDKTHALVLQGTALDVEDRRLVNAFVDRVGSGLQQQRIAKEAAELRAIAEADALRTGLLRAVSHDLRTPLATIEANVSSLLQPDVTWSHDEERSFLVAIEREVHRLTRLVANLLDAGRLEAGVVTPRRSAVDLEDVVASALETIDTQGRRLEIDLPEDLPTLRTDPDLLERVIANLVANACRFGPPSQPVRISAGSTPRGVALLVADRGPGIREHDRAGVVAPFQRLDDQGSGAGLGLTVVSGFVELLGGELRFEDTPGGGLTAVVELSGEAGQ